MGIIWLVIPIMQMALCLAIPFLLAITITKRTIKNPESFLVTKVFSCIGLVVFSAIVIANQQKGWPTLFIFVQSITTLLFIFLYLREMDKFSSKLEKKD